MIQANPKVCGIQEMASILGCTQSWLKEEAAANRIPSLRMGARQPRFLFNPDAVMDELAKRAAQSGNDDAA